MPRLPSKHDLVDQLVTMVVPYAGSGSTSRLGTKPRLGMGLTS